MASGDVTLTLTNGATSDGKNAFYELTGTLTGNRTLTMPSGAERSIIVKDSTTRGSGSTLFSLSVQTASGTSVPITNRCVCCSCIRWHKYEIRIII